MACMRRLVSSQAKKHGKFGTALSGKAAFECMSNNVPAAFDSKAAILDGAGISKAWQEELKKDAAEVRQLLGRRPGLAVITVGDQPDSRLYVQRKEEACSRVGIATSLKRLRQDVSQQQLEGLVRHLCDQKDVDGLLVQLPLPPHLNEEAVIDALDPSKDVDGFHPVNVGRLIMQNKQRSLVPCTALGCLELLKRSKIDLHGKEAVLMGDSNVVGTPLAMLLRSSGVASLTLCSRPSMQALFDDRKLGTKRASAEVCLPRLPGPSDPPLDNADQQAHLINTESKASNNDLHQGNTHAARSAESFDLPSITKRADLLVVAVGSPELVKADWVKPGAVVLDVGINVEEDDNGKSHILGDVAFEEVSQIAAAITPVPGGIGPMTIAALLNNTIQAAYMHANVKQESSRNQAAAGSA